MENQIFENIKPEHLKPQLSTKLYKNTYVYLQTHYSTKIFDEICAELQMPQGYLLSNHNWISLEFAKKFASLIRQKTGDPEIYRKIGQRFLSEETVNAVDYTLLKTLTPGIVLNIIKKNYRHTNAVCELQIDHLAWGHLRFTCKSKEPMYIDLIQNSLGVLDSLKNIFDLKLFSCSPEYDLEANPYEFSVQVTYSSYLFLLRRTQKVVTFLALAAMTGFGLEYLADHFSIRIIPVLGILLFTGMMISRKLYQSIKILQRSDDDLHTKNIQKNMTIYEKAEQLERSYNEANLLKQLSGELISHLEPARVIDETLKACHENFNFSRVAVFLVSAQRQRLSLSSSLGFQIEGNARAIEFVYPNPNAKDGFFAAVLENGKSVLITEVDKYKTNLTPSNRMLMDHLNVGSMIVIPLQSLKNKFGVLVVVRDKGDALLTQTEVSLVENIGSIFSLYFENALNLENESKLRQIFQKYVPRQVLDTIVDSHYLSTGTLQPQKRKIVSFFADLRGFTAATENIPAEQVFELVNIYCNFLTEKLAKHGAIIDNIIGDQIVCFFSQKNIADQLYVKNSFLALTEMIGDIAKFQNEMVQKGYPALRFGIGIHIGEASVGSVGTDDKMNFTALGSTVNLASRLQAICKRYPDGEVVACLSRAYVEALGLDSKVRYIVETLRGSTEPTAYIVLTNINFNKFLEKRLKVS